MDEENRFTINLRGLGERATQFKGVSNSLADEKLKAIGFKAASQAGLVVIVANGFLGHGNNTKKEIRAVKNGVWLPNTQDFIATANFTMNNGQYYGAKNTDEFLGAIAKPPKINRVIFIGHGAPYAIGFSGDTDGFLSQALGSYDLPKWQEFINQKIKPKLAKNATIDLVACNIGIGEKFMKDLAKAFGRCVRAFPYPVLWLLQWNNEETVITSRGLIKLETKDGDVIKGVESLSPPRIICSQ